MPRSTAISGKQSRAATKKKNGARKADAFSDIFDRLNEEQRTAVEVIEGPVLCVAGPGTGKTQVLAVRVANILRRTQARPANILCLTFSNAGATAMRDRLRTLIGPDAYAVTVSTVHGFCDTLIARNVTTFSEFSAAKPISDLEKYKLMEKLIDEVSSSSALINPKNPYERISAILSRISDCKREGKTLDDLRRVSKEYAAQMEQKSKKETKQHEKNLLAAQKFSEFVELFRRYQEELTERRLYDYDDMILVVLKALSEEDWLLAGLQERYQYILIDEAQDLNGAQWKVIERLTTYDTVPHEPNFFLVGDDDQSIYRFQGANMEHLLTFRKRFPGAPVVALQTSYRSTQKILDAAGRLISRNDERLIGRIPGLLKDLNAATVEAGIEPMLLRPPSDAAEPWLIADLCEERIASGIPPEEIAVLVQTNLELRPIYDVLRARGIPVILQGKTDLLSHPIVAQALAILRYVESPRDNELLHALACECFGVAAADLGRITASAREAKKKSIDVLLDLENSGFSLSAPEAILRARDTLLDLEQKKETRTLLDTMEHLLRECGLSAETKDPLDLAAVEAFFQYTKQSCLDRPFLSLQAFLRDLEFYADEAHGQLRLTYQVPHLVTAGVQLLTAHQSKGLEFHTVMLAGFREGHWDERQNPSRLSLPEELLFGWEPEQKRYEKHQDERRIAYVAMTRAKRELIMLCPKEFAVGERARAVSPSAFFAEAGPLPERDAALKDPERSSLLLLHPKRELPAEHEAYIRERIESFALSPSALTAFLVHPEEFRRVYLLGQPEHLSEGSLRALGYGSAVHWALKEWAAAQKEGRAFAEAELLKAFTWHLNERTILTRKQRDDLIAFGSVALPKYFEGKLRERRPFLYAFERDVRARLADPEDPTGPGIALKGKIDRIDLASETSADAVIIDYKTGTPKTPFVIRGGIDPGKISWRKEGENFRQLVFYALLLEQAEPLLVPQAFALEFIGERGEDPATREFSVSEQEKDHLRSLIRAVWTKIQALDFTPI